MAYILRPSMSLLCKLGSIAIHAEEFMSPRKHTFDGDVLRTLLEDPEVKEWLKGMDREALIPKKR